jgi:enoyl-CoA hydratase
MAYNGASAQRHAPARAAAGVPPDPSFTCSRSPMSSECLLCAVEQGHARLTLNRPEAHNALDGELVRRLGETLAALRDDPAVRVVTVQGAGSSFCAGADLKQFLAVLDDAPAMAAYLRAVRETFTALERFPRPVIAVVHGYVLAGGLELLLACDLAIAAEDAQLGDQHINFGLLPGGGASQRLPRLLGPRKAKELMLLGSRVSGAEAARLGLVNRAVPAAELERTAAEWVATLREKSPAGLRTMKEMLQGADATPLEAGLALEEGAFLGYARLPDLREGLTAFKEKRKPRY